MTTLMTEAAMLLKNSLDPLAVIRRNCLAEMFSFV